MWGPNPIALPVNVQIGNNLIGLTPVAPADAAAALITPGAAIIHELDITCDVLPVAGNAAGFYGFGFGLWIAEYDRTNAAFSDQGMYSPGDAERDNWLELSAHSQWWPAANALTCSTRVHYQRNFRTPIRIDQGQMLTFGVCADGLNPNACVYIPYIRWKISRMF
jgi:hypothetical protein